MLVMLAGTLVAESLRVGAVLEGIPLAIRKVSRADVGDAGAGQPVTWTLIDFVASADQAEPLARSLAACLEERLGWYCDFRTERETFVVFAGRIFRYPRGDPDGRAEAEGYARAKGVPEAELDWPV